MIARTAFRVCVTLLALTAVLTADAQSLDDLNLQFHGFATQSFVKSQNDNWNTMGTVGGSAAWTEAVLNVSSEPTPKLRIAFQGRYSLLGTIGNSISLDWADADYKVNEQLGFRAGKVKTPAGMLNEAQDIDPAEQWILMPQGVYQLASGTRRCRTLAAWCTGPRRWANWVRCSTGAGADNG
jgi:hypothetical protein